MATGQSIPGAMTPSSGACVRFRVPPEGELVALAGRDEARAAEGVVDARVYRRPGFVFGPFLRGSDRAGFVLATGSSRDDALAKAGRAADSIRFETEDAAVLQQT